MNHTVRKIGQQCAPWVVFGSFALVQTRNAFFSPVAVILGGADEPDWTGTLWTYWWTWKALLSGADPTVASHNLFPVGLDPVAQYNLLDALLLGWLIPVVGPTRGYNLCGLVVLLLAGWTGMTMARQLGATRWSAVCAGLLLQSSTMVTVEVTGGRLSQALLPFAGLAFVGLLRLFRTDTDPAQAVRTGLFTAGTALVYWYAALFVALGTLPTAARAIRQRWRPLMLAMGVCLAVCSPALFALAGHGTDLAGMERAPVSWMADESWTFGRYGLGMALSQAYPPAWPIWSTPGTVQARTLAPLLMVLAAIGAARGPRIWTRPLLSAVAMGWILTLGPWLKSFDGTPLRIPLPWLLLETMVPYFDRLWWPGRFEMVVVLGLTPLAAFGLQALAERWSARTVTIGFGVLFAIQLGVARPHHPIPASPPRAFDAELYASLDGPLLTVPVMAPVPDIRFVQWLQVLHQQPVTGGLGEHLPGHLPAEWEAFVDSNRLLDLLRDATTEPIVQRVVLPEDVEHLRNAGLRWVVVDRAVLSRDRPDAWMRRHRALLSAVWGAPDVETAGGMAWRIDAIEKTIRIPDQGSPPVLAPPDAFAAPRRHRGGSDRP